MGEGEGGGGQSGLFSPSPQSPPVEGGEGNQLKSNQIFIIALQGIVKTYYRPPCLKCAYCQKLSPLSPLGERVRVRGKKDFSDGLQNTF